jgi:hypothetical protein
MDDDRQNKLPAIENHLGRVMLRRAKHPNKLAHDRLLPQMLRSSQHDT